MPMSLELPATLTPSKITSFVNCPLAFRFSYIDRLPEPASPQLVLGTLVHRALQLLFTRGLVTDRTPKNAQGALDAAWDELRNSEEVLGLGFDNELQSSFLHQATTLLEHYFTLEDPVSVTPVGIELDLRTALENIELRGIIDRLDYLRNGEFAITDYKTGRSPRPEQSRARLLGVHFYAFLCEQILKRRPREVRLMYLKDQVVIVDTPTDQTMRGLRQRAVAVWAAIEQACIEDNFRPHRSALCKTCAFQAFCPEFGGDPKLARCGD